MKNLLSEAQAKSLLENKLLHFFGVSADDATYEQFYRAIALILVDIMAKERADFNKRGDESGAKRVYYLSMEFLMGRSLKNNLFNLNLTKTFDKILKGYGVSLEKLYDCEPDAGLGNGGLGRLAACYLDGLATSGYPARGYSILYQFGIFKQKLLDGWQIELPDEWLPGGDIWLTKREESAVYVNFEGYVKEAWNNTHHHVELANTTAIKAVPYDMFVAGKDGKGISVLRLWSSEGTGIDVPLFNAGQHLKAVERDAMAQTISKILYPSDNNPEGKSLRLKQQYFLVSATVQDIVRRHLRDHGTVESIPEKIAIHINDTHPTLVIPELMRILLDECGYGWDEAWNIVTSTVAYTNHTVMAEALECWGEDLVQRLMPRIYQIIKEIDNRFRAYVWSCTYNHEYVERTAIIYNGAVRMANLCIAACHTVNGVSALHSEILKETVFNDFYKLTPEKFTNVTNGIAHRRWLCQANPKLTELLTKKIGDGFITNGAELIKFRDFADDKAVLEKIGEIKLSNKKRFADFVKKTTGIELDPSSLFDVQVKRLHEYKRQELNAFHILSKYLEIKANPNGQYVPHTYIFGAKAAPGYDKAKKIISFICAIANMVNNDPEVNRFMKVVFIEDYNVTKAELLMPAADISEQISLAGTEASGTGNMKLMINGAITLGTMDGANIEIHDSVGEDNIIIFGMRTNEVNHLSKSGYNPSYYYHNNPTLRRVIDFINNSLIDGKSFKELGEEILREDKYMLLADFADYALAQRKAEEIFLDKTRLNKMALYNISGAGIFAADRSINDYARDIWHTVKAKSK